MVQGPPKAINHGGTRFPPQLAPSASATPSASSAGGGGGGVLSGNGGDGPSRAAAAAAAAAGTRGYSILATPSFNPGVEDTPLMTWGDIEGTPMRIEAEDLPPGPVLEGGCQLAAARCTARTRVPPPQPPK
jgi:protein DGCR14